MINQSSYPYYIVDLYGHKLTNFSSYRLASLCQRYFDIKTNIEYYE